MTQAELDAIPEIGKLTFEERIIDGRKVRIPMCLGRRVVFNPTFVTGVDGKRWIVGSHDGALCKQQVWRGL